MTTRPLPWLNDLPNLDPNVLEGVEELQRDCFIKNAPKQGSDQLKALTEKGRTYVEVDLQNMKLPSVDIDDVLTRKDLADLVRQDFLNGYYDRAIRSATLRLEEAVRASASQPPTAIGSALKRTAFTRGTGFLTQPVALAPPEQDAFLRLFLGANGWLRNPNSHRTVGCQDPQEAAQILGIVNYLLDRLEECI
jgi:hypothetical protein